MNQPPNHDAPRSGYDVFLSYNSQDGATVEEIARKLMELGITCFLDRWYLPKGQPWRSLLEENLAHVRAVAVFVGPQGMGPWQHREIDVALDRQARSTGFPVIPVLLPGCEPPLGFLRQNTWIDRRNQPLDQVVTLLKKSIRGEAPGPDSEARFAAARSMVCPYRGLLYFREEDAPFFFGRDAAIKDLGSAVSKSSWVTVLGASGSGKSSVVRAGLVPLLRHDRNMVWEIAFLIPGDEPLKALAGALMPLLFPELDPIKRRVKVNRLAAEFSAGTISLRDMVRDVLERQTGTQRLLLVADQWEELYTLTKDDGERKRFIDELLDAASRSPLTVVLTLRGDFAGKALAYRPLSDRMQGTQVNLGPMNGEELELAVRRPAMEVGLKFETGLAGRILADVGGEPGNLPLLEFVLRELWENRGGGRLLHEAYERMGKLEGAVAAKAEVFFEKLTDPEKEAAKRLFLQLVHAGEEGHDTRRRERLRDIPQSSHDLVGRLAHERLLVAGGTAESGGETVEVAHEALIRNWTRLGGWLREDREFLLWRERLRALLGEWERGGRNSELLLRGPVLAEAEGWLHRHREALSENEAEFILAGLEARRKQQEKQREQQERELKLERERAETLKRLAGEQKRAAALERQRAEAARERAATAEQLTEKAKILAEERQLAADAAVAHSKELENAAAVLANAAVRLKIRLRTAIGLGSFAVVCATVAWFFYGQASLDREAAENARSAAQKSAGEATEAGRKEKRNAILSQSQALVAEARQVRDTRPMQSLLLAAAAVEISRTQLEDKTVLPAAHQTLRDALSGVGGEGLVGHKGDIQAVAISLDGHWAFTHSGDIVGREDNTARLWNLQAANTSAQPVVLKGHEDTITTVAISSDNHWALTGSRDKTARLWDLREANPSAKSVVLKGHENTITAIAISLDGHWALTGSGDIVGRADNTARLWNLKAADPSVKPVELKGHEGRITAVAISSDNHWALTGSRDKTARLWNLQTADPSAKSVVLRGHESGITAVVISPDGHWALTVSSDIIGGGDNTARLWNLQALDPSAKSVVLRGHESEITAVAISLDSRWVLTGSQDTNARLWDLNEADPSAKSVVLRGHESGITAVVISPDGHWALTGSQDNTARLWNLQAANPSAQPVVLRGHEDTITAVAFSPDSHQALTGSRDSPARLWNLQAANPSAQPVVLRGHEDNITAVAFGPDSHQALTGSRDSTARLWDLWKGNASSKLVVPKGDESGSTAVAFSLDNHWALTSSRAFVDDEDSVGGGDNTARLWNLRTGDQLAKPFVLKGHEMEITAVAFSPDSHWALTGSWDSTVRLWDLQTADPSVKPVVLRGHESTITALAFSPDSRWALTGSRDFDGGGDKTARLWDLQAAPPSEKPVVLRGHEEGITAVAFSPDGRWALTGSMDKTARLWDLQAVDPSAKSVVLRGHESGITVMAFSPDSHWALTGSWENNARLWNLQALDPSAKPVVLKGHENMITAMAFSPDSHWALTGSWDNTARLWDLREADPSTKSVVLKGHKSKINAVAFSRDGHWVLTGSDDNTARLWLLNIEDLLALAKHTLGRNLTLEEWAAFMPGKPYFKIFPDLPNSEF